MLQSVLNIIKKNKVPDSPVLGIELGPAGVAVARVATDADGGMKLQSCEFIACTAGEWEGKLKAYIETHKLKGSNCYVTLHSSYYNLMLVDAPDVDDDELGEAVKWRVKDLIRQSIDDVIVDTFRLPGDAYRGRMDMVYVAIIEKTIVASIVNGMEECGINLQKIGINELSDCHFASVLRGCDDQGVAFIQLEKNAGTINLTENGLMYLTRSIEMGVDSVVAANENNNSDGGLSLDTSAPMDSLALDIQRSLDYYESQLGKQGINKIFVMPTASSVDGIVEVLDEKLHAQLSVLPLSKIVESAESEDGHIQRCVAATGAALDGVIGAAFQEINFYHDCFKRVKAVLPARQVLAVAAGLAAILVAVGFVNLNAMSALDEQVVKAEKRQQKLQSQLEKLRILYANPTVDPALEKQSQQLSRSIKNNQKMVRFLTGQEDIKKTTFSAVMDGLAENNMNGVWLTAIDIKHAGNSYRLVGETQRADLLPEYIGNLKNADVLDGISFSLFDLERSEKQTGYLHFTLSSERDDIETASANI